jgi:hypothetical protein
MVTFRSATTRWAPASRSESACPPLRSTPSTSAKPPVAPAATPLTASSSTAASAGVTPSALAACTNIAGSGLPASSCSSAVRPSTTVTNRPRMPAASSTVRAFFDDDTIADGTPAASSMSSRAIASGYGGDAVAFEHGVERVVLPVAHRADRVVPGRVVGGARRQVDPARLEERRDSVVARLAVDVGEVVGPREPPRGEQLGPRSLVDLGGGRDHAVEVEQDRSERGPVDREVWFGNRHGGRQRKRVSRLGSPAPSAPGSRACR